MNIFNKRKVFISHKRLSGQATPEAILVRDALEQKGIYDTFMDVREDYVGRFPDTLKESIKHCDVFVLVLPSNMEHDYLLDKDNWVRKEVYYALESKEFTQNRPSRIIPVAFDKNWKFPEKELLGEISGIADYNILFFDTNDSNSVQKIHKAIGGSKCSCYITWKSILLTFFVAIAAILCVKIVTPPSIDEEMMDRNVKEFVSEMKKYNSFDEFYDKSQEGCTKLFTWYLSELNTGKHDVQLNEQFNKYYVKEYCVRMTVLIYLAYTSNSLDSKNDAAFVESLITECYSKIPEKNRYPIGLDNYTNEERTNIFSSMIDSVFETLEEKPQLKKIPIEYQVALKNKLMEKLWPSEF